MILGRRAGVLEAEVPWKYDVGAGERCINQLNDSRTQWMLWHLGGNALDRWPQTLPPREDTPAETL